MADTASSPEEDEELPGASDARPIVVVSNRQPYRHSYAEDGEEVVVDRPTGGLTAGLDPVMQRVGGTWIAWGDGEADREVVDDDDRVAVPPEDPSYEIERVWLTDEQVEEYYYGFANQVLWPICHSALGTVRVEPGFWKRYREVNERFAEPTIAAAEPGAVVWLQDYHFGLAPRIVQPELPEDAVLAQFWHVPWPGWDVFRACPHGETLLDGLLGNDLLGFHVQRYAENFADCVEAALDESAVDREGMRIQYGGHDTHLEVAPMGVDAGLIQYLAADPEGPGFRSTFKAEHGIDPGTTVAVGVDRLDYTKGIPERLRALEHLWETRPEWRGRLTYVQSGSESRSAIPAYSDLQERVRTAVDRINGRFGTEDWQPVVFTTEWLSGTELASLYRMADLAVVSPVRDGMNLVAQEYVAAQTEGEGALLLSDQTGAHESLGIGAVTVSPFDPASFADAIERAAEMPAAERRERIALMDDQVREQDLSAWVRAVLRSAEALAGGDYPPVPV